VSTISDWVADYTGADTNVPQSNTAIPFPANTTTDLGQTLRDMKAVIRQESLNKGWEPDPQSVTYVSNTTFTLVGDLVAEWTPGTAIKCDLGASEVQTWIADAQFGGANTTVTTTNAALANTLVMVTRSAFKVSSTPTREVAWDYPMGFGTALPMRVTQRGRFHVSASANTVTVTFAKTEPNTNYRPLIQLMVTAADPTSNEAARIVGIVKSAANMALTFAAADTDTRIFEYALVRAV